MTTSKREYIQLVILAIMIALFFTNFYFIVIVFGASYYGWRGYELLTKGYVSNSKLEQARDEALRVYLPSPGVSDAWKKWSKKTSDSMFDDEFPGSRNGAVRQYLNDEYDGNVMDARLGDRIWPRDEFCLAGCERDERRPWEFKHELACQLHPDWVDPDADLDEVVNLVHPIDRPIARKDRIDFNCGCCAVMSGSDDRMIIRRGMGCGRDHYEELDQNPHYKMKE